MQAPAPEASAAAAPSTSNLLTSNLAADAAELQSLLAQTAGAFDSFVQRLQAALSATLGIPVSAAQSPAAK